MNTLESRIGQALQSNIAFLLIVALLLWTMGVPALLNHAKAAQLTLVSDTLTSSNLSTPAGHNIQFTVTSPIQPSQTIQIDLDENTNSFGAAYSAATSTDFGFYVGGTTKYSFVANAAACSSGNQVYATGNYSATPKNLTITLCGAATQIATSSVVNIGIATSTAATKVWTNPASTGSYRIVLSGTNPNVGETRVAILQNVTVTASVNTSFTFTVFGEATTTSFGGVTTSASSTATSLPFSTLASSTGFVTLGQTLTVSTNAKNGFAVTVQENQPPTSATGAIINLFDNGATTSTPIAWAAPAATLDVPSTYSHFGITSDDTDLNANEFGGATKWAGNFDQPRVVFSHTGPADGSTQNKGLAHVGYRMQVSDLQPAGTDYTDILTYVATPTF